MFTNRQNLGLLLGVLGVIVFAGSLPASRIAVTEVSPYFLTAMRAMLAGLGGAVDAHRDAQAAAAAASVVAAAGRAPFTIVLGFPLLSAVAMVTVPSAQGGVILGIMPLMTTAAAAVIEGERPSPGFWVAAVDRFGAGDGLRAVSQRRLCALGGRYPAAGSR